VRKTIITVLAFWILFGFAVSGVMAQTTWTWDTPALIDNVGIFFTDFKAFPDYPELRGLDPADDSWNMLTTLDFTGSTTVINGTLNLNDIVDSVAAPPFALIDLDTVGIWDGSSYVELALQPTVPDLAGAFAHIAAGTDGTLYVIFEDITKTQYVLTGTPNTFTWEEATVRFTPRSLNLGSNGKWMTCKVNAVAGHTWDEVELSKLCIVGINDELITVPVCVDTTGPSNKNNSKKMMVKFDRKALAGEIAAQIAANPDLDPTSTKITLAYTDGTLSFYGDDTIKTKPAKVKKPKKK
jgi:hypothetical protein